MKAQVEVRYEIKAIGFAVIYVDEEAAGSADWQKGARRMSDYDGWTFRSYNNGRYGFEPNQLVAISKILQKLNRDVPDPYGLNRE